VTIQPFVSVQSPALPIQGVAGAESPLRGRLRLGLIPLAPPRPLICGQDNGALLASYADGRRVLVLKQAVGYAEKSEHCGRA